MEGKLVYMYAEIKRREFDEKNVYSGCKRGDGSI